MFSPYSEVYCGTASCLQWCLYGFESGAEIGRYNLATGIYKRKHYGINIQMLMRFLTLVSGLL